MKFIRPRDILAGFMAFDRRNGAPLFGPAPSSTGADRRCATSERIAEALHGLRVEAPVGSLNGRDARKIADVLIAELGLVDGETP